MSRPPCDRAFTEPISAEAPRRHGPNFVSASMPANTACPATEPKAPPFSVPSRVRCSAIQPARRPSKALGGRHEQRCARRGLLPGDTVCSDRGGGQAGGGGKGCDKAAAFKGKVGWLSPLRTVRDTARLS